MNKPSIFFIGLVALASTLSFALGASLTAPRALAQKPAATPVFTDDNMPSASTPALPLAAATPVNPGDRLVYFTPQDSNGTATVINLYNTTDVATSVNVKGMALGNFVLVNCTIEIQAGGLRRLVSDGLAAGAPPSWTNYDYNCSFGDSSLYGVMSIPANVHFDGYMVFNADTMSIDPNLDQGALPLRFSADPLTVLLPEVLR